MSRAFSCANRPLFIRCLVENFTLKLVFFTETQKFFLIYLSVAKGKKKKKSEFENQKGNIENKREREEGQGEGLREGEGREEKHTLDLK